MSENEARAAWPTQSGNMSPAAWSTQTGDMSPEDFQRYGDEIVRWIADYIAHPERFPVLSRVAPGEVRARLPDAAPERAESMEAVLQDFADIIVPGITHWNHPGFFAYFAITGSGPGILAELLAAALNVNGMLWRTSPAATELEEVALDWLRQLVGLPATFEGIIYDTASISTLVAVAAAREATGLDTRRRGLSGLPPLRLYCSQEAHSSVEKAAITLGLGQDGVRAVPVDAAFRMDTGALRQHIEQDLASGDRPFCVIATVGTTSTTSVDPVPQIAEICEEYGLWLHVDAAYGGAAAILPEKRWVLDDVHRADSLVINPHKWLFTPVDLSAFYSRRLPTVRDAFSLVPEYLRTPEREVRNYMDYGPQLGRRFRALKLWFVLRAFGREGIMVRLREHIRLADAFSQWVERAPRWEIVAPHPFSTICFRFHPDNADGAELDWMNEHILERVNAGGEVYLSHTVVHGRYTLRLAIGNLRTTEDTVRRAWAALEEAAAQVRGRAIASD